MPGDGARKVLSESTLLLVEGGSMEVETGTGDKLGFDANAGGGEGFGSIGPW